MGTASSTRNRQMIKCLRQMDFIRLLSPKVMRCDTSRIESPVELVRSIARREGPSVFFVLFDLRRSYREQTTGATKKKQAYGSLSSPACSCVAFTLPASSRWLGGKCPPISKSPDAAPF